MRVFGDTVYLLALINPSDQYHQQAVSISRNPPGSLITTEWVLTEVGDALSQPPNRALFSRLLAVMASQQDVEIIPASSALFQRGCDFHARRTDKEWSLTDCISFVVMADQHLQHALTTDHHFVQAGFRCLMTS